MADINVGAITEALNNKVDLPTPSTPQDAVDYVVEKQDPTSANGYTWYRKYKSGWVEQGGRLTGTKSEGFNTVTLPVEMQDNNYTAFTTNISGYMAGTGSSHAYVMAKAGVVNSLTTTSIGVFSQNSGEKYSWQVSGYAA